MSSPAWGRTEKPHSNRKDWENIKQMLPFIWNSTMDEMEQLGVRILSSPKPGEAFDNELITFLYAGHGLNFEVIETTKRRSIKSNEEM